MSWSLNRLLVWYTHRGLLRKTPGREASGCHLNDFLLSHSRSLVSPEKELIHLSGTPTFANEAQGTLLDHLVLMAYGTYT